MVDSYKITKTNSFDSDRPPLEFGVEIPHDGTTVCTRLGDSANFTVNTGANPHVSDFTNYYPWKGMRRVQMWPIGDIYADWKDLRDDGQTAYSSDCTFCMVEIPKFWVRYEWSGAPTEPTTWKDHLYIYPYPLKGYELHPAFLRSGLIIDHIYVGAFEAYQHVSGPGMEYDYLQSTANKTPTTNLSRAVFREMATRLNWKSAPDTYGLNLMDIYTWSAIQMLYLVEYASLDCQSYSGSTAIGGIGSGIAYLDHVVSTGWTSAQGQPGCKDLGSLSGNVQVLGDHWAMSYRGIENIWGNTQTIIDGINIQMPYGRVWLISLSNTCVFRDDAADFNLGYYPAYSVIPYGGNGYSTDMGLSFAKNEAFQFLPRTLGGTDHTYYCDYFTGGAESSVNRSVAVGGMHSSQKAVGIFNTSIYYDPGTGEPSYGTRIQYVPYDFTGINRY